MSFTQELWNAVCEHSLQIMQDTSLRVWKLKTPVLHTKQATFTRAAF